MKDSKFENSMTSPVEIKSIMEKACQKIAPLSSLQNFVAVNPYFGLSHLSFTEAAKMLSKTGSSKITMPVSFYQKAIEEGVIMKEDLEKALLSDELFRNYSVDHFLKQIKQPVQTKNGQQKISLVTDVASEISGNDWSHFMKERITFWAAAYFDKGQALWRTSPSGQNMFLSWKTETAADATPKLMGLKGFSKAVRKLPGDAFEAAAKNIEYLGISPENLELYLFALLQKTGGWSAYCAGLDWDNRLYGGEQNNLLTFLSVLLSWERCLLESLAETNLMELWEQEKKQWDGIRNAKGSRKLHIQLILQEAFDHANQRKLVEKINLNPGRKQRKKDTPDVQAVFCIDVRSEVFRRNLEMVSPRIQTLGFAGFFGFPVKYVPIGNESGQNQCPVLIPAKKVIMETLPGKEANEKILKKRKTAFQVEKAWKSFKHGAISCFSFMGPVGMSFLPKIFTDSYGITRPVPHPSVAGIGEKNYKQREISLETGQYNGMSTGIALNEQIQMAASALKAMSLTDNFARIVLIAGHGSTTTNNPHASGLDCGACGGNTGEVNARLASMVLNNSDVRKGLEAHKIVIPDDTIFIAALHDTTTDEVVLLNENQFTEGHKNDIDQMKKWLKLAGKTARSERVVRFPGADKGNIDKLIFQRSKDWSQVRPEWGLAGCNNFIVAPRERTENINLDGKSFLHTYQWKLDKTFDVLELIMTAPMIVTNWINMQYYASVVDNENFGSGNKTLHNVTGGIGVLEGYSGDLRTGLPWQSVHDGHKFQHLPHRLNVIIEAPLEAMNEIIRKHQVVKNLLNNKWIHLFAMDEEGQVAFAYQGDLNWKTIYQPKKEALVA